MSPFPNDPYCYPGTDVLINHGDYRVQAELNKFEADAVLLASAALKARPISGPFDIARLRETHRRLFANVYPWAGELRKGIGMMTKERSGFVVTYGPSENVPTALAQTLLLNSPQAMQAIKRLLSMHAKRRLEDEIEDAIEINVQQRSAEDFKEGVPAFKQHRRADWPSMHVKV